MTLLEIKSNIKKLFLKVRKLETQVRPLVIEDTPYALGLVPEYVGQIVVQPNNSKVWIAFNAQSWTYIILD